MAKQSNTPPHKISKEPGEKAVPVSVKVDMTFVDTGLQRHGELIMLQRQTVGLRYFGALDIHQDITITIPMTDGRRSSVPEVVRGRVAWTEQHGEMIVLWVRLRTPLNEEDTPGLAKVLLHRAF